MTCLEMSSFMELKGIGSEINKIKNLNTEEVGIHLLFRTFSPCFCQGNSDCEEHVIIYPGKSDKEIKLQCIYINEKKMISKINVIYEGEWGFTYNQNILKAGSLIE